LINLKQKYCSLSHPKLAAISTGVIIFGGIVLGIGFDMIFGEKVEKLNSDLEEAKENIRVYDIGEPLTFDLTSAFDPNGTLPAKSIFLTLEKDIIFARDTVKITAKAIDVKNDVSGFLFVLNDGTISFTNETTNKEIIFEGEYAEKHNLLLELSHETKPPFVDETSPRFNRPDVTYHVTGVILFKNESKAVINNSDGLFPIYSKINKLQVDTNKAILEQTDITKISNIQQEITNQVITGLTVIGIAIIPIVGGFDVLIRIYLDKNNNHTHKKWHMPFYD